MNKQELIDHCKTLKEDKNRFINCIDVDRIIDAIKQLDEPEKVKVPQCVADWIEVCKTFKHFVVNLSFALQPIAWEKNNLSDKCINWLMDANNQELFARAWLDGYEVEEEKRYLVKLKGVYHGDLGYAETFNGYSFYNKDRNLSGIKYKHTHKELEEANFGWVFDCEGIEIEEVE